MVPVLCLNVYIMGWYYSGSTKDKQMRKVVALLFVLVLAGCSGVDKLGEVAGTKFYTVHAEHFWGPNFTALVVEKDGQAGIVKVGFGPGAGHAIVGATVGAAGDVGASAVQWHGYKPDVRHGDSFTVSGVSGAGSTAVANQQQGQAQGQAQEQKQEDKEDKEDCPPKEDEHDD